MSLSESEKNKIARVVEALKDSESILFVTGAGVSADSGLPTYRGVGGLYNEKHTDEGIPIEDAISGDMLKQHPAITWKYLAQIEKSCRGAKCNRAHEVMALMEKEFSRVWVLTQNIDGFHHLAGSKKVIDIHGDTHSISCMRCSYHKIIKDYSEIEIPPKCPDCGGDVRPDVVLFGEMLDVDKLNILRDELERGFDIVFSVGTTSVFPYIAAPVYQAKRAGKPTVEINPSRTEVSDYVDIKIAGGAAQVLDLIWEEYQKAK